MKYTIVVSERMHLPEKYALFNHPKWDRPCLIEQVQIRIKDGWEPIGGATYGKHEEFEGEVWAQAMIKQGSEEE